MRNGIPARLDSTLSPSPATSKSTVIDVTEVVAGLHRVGTDDLTLGYVLRVGRVYVALQGRVYNTAVEVGQTLDFDAAVRKVAV